VPPFSESAYRDFLLPRKKRLNNPARVSARSRVFARVRGAEPGDDLCLLAINDSHDRQLFKEFQVSRLHDESLRFSLISQSRKCLIGGLRVTLLPFGDVALNVCPHATCAHTESDSRGRCNRPFASMTVGTTISDQRSDELLTMAWRGGKVSFNRFRQGLPTIKGLGNVRGIRARKLEEDVSTKLRGSRRAFP